MRPLLAILLAAVLVACEGGELTTVSREISAEAGGTVALGDQVTVRIAPGALRSDATVSIARASEERLAPSGLEFAGPIGEPVAIDLDDENLAKPVTLELAFDPERLPAGTPDHAIFAAYYADVDDLWVPVGGQVDRERNVIVVETAHLSWWQVWTWDLSEITSILLRALEGIVDPSRFVAVQPQCTAGDPTVTLSFDEVFLACDQLTIDSGQVRVRISNNRTYGLSLDLPPSVTVDAISRGSFIELAMETLKNPFGDSWYVPPAGQVELLVHFDQAGELYLAFERDHWAGAVDGLLSFIMIAALQDPQRASFGPIDATCIEHAAAIAADLETKESAEITAACKQAISGLGGFSVLGTVVQLLDDLVDTISLHSSVVTVTYSPPAAITSFVPSRYSATRFELTIRGENFDDTAVVEVYTSSGDLHEEGKIVSRSASEIVTMLDFSGAANGAYTVSVRNANGRVSAPGSLRIEPLAIVPWGTHGPTADHYDFVYRINGFDINSLTDAELDAAFERPWTGWGYGVGTGEQHYISVSVPTGAVCERFTLALNLPDGRRADWTHRGC